MFGFSPRKVTIQLKNDGLHRVQLLSRFPIVYSDAIRLRPFDSDVPVATAEKKTPKKQREKTSAKVKIDWAVI